MNECCFEGVCSHDFAKMGLQPAYFGTHSICKGSIAHGACGVANAPLIASLYVHVNWNMLGLMNHAIDSVALPPVTSI